MRAGGIVRKLFVLLVLLLVIVALLPMIVAKTPLRHVLLSMALPADAIRISIGDATLNWIGRQSVGNLDVRDATGESLLTAEAIRFDRSPLTLALNTHELGTLEIVRPLLHLKVRPDGSNLEDVIHKLASRFGGSSQPNQTSTVAPPETKITDSGTSNKQPIAFAIQLSDGTIIADDLATGRQWRLQNVNLQIDTHGNARSAPGLATGQIVVSDRGGPPIPAGRFALAIKPADGGRQQLTFQADQIALAMAEPWLRRVAAGSELSGTLSAQVTASWTNGSAAFPSDLVTAGNLAVDRLDAASPALHGDRIRLARVELPWQANSQVNGLTIDNLELRTDAARAVVRGRLDPAVFAQLAGASASTFLNGRHELEMRGSLDVPKLAAMLPHTMRVRSDTTITGGTIDIAASMKPGPDGQAVTGSVVSAQLAATNAGKQINWDQPLNASFAIRRTKGTFAVDSLKCDSKFLHIEGAGNQQQLAANANFDLNALAEQLRQFIDLSGVQLAGTGSAQVALEQPADGKFVASASSQLSQFRVALSDQAAWEEPQLTVRADAAGVVDPVSHRPSRVDSAQLQVNGQGDQLDAKLIAPVDFTATPVFPISVHSSGSIAHWLARVRPWFAPADWKVDGASELTANVRVNGNTFETTDTKLTVTNLRAASPDWNINEARIEFTGDAHWDGAKNEFTAHSAQLVSSTVALATRDIHYGGTSQAAGQLTGAAAFRADLARLAACRATPGKRPDYLPSGEFTGNIRFAQQAGRITGEISASGQNLLLTSLDAKNGGQANGYQTIWQEPIVSLHGSTNYDAAADRLSFDQFQIQSNTLQANAAGQIQKLSTVAQCDLNGTLNYDLAQVTPLLRPYVGAGIQLAGREQARFSLGGSLISPNQLRAQTVALSPPSAIQNPQSTTPWSRRVHAQLELPWSGANLYGLPIGGGKLAATLGDGAARFEPLNLAVGEGQLTIAPIIRFDPEPAELTLPGGPVLTNVRISPEVSEAMLKFVAPVLAGATQSEGLFSLQLDGARVPLGETAKADSSGQLTVHSVRVVPGPMAAQWVGFAQQIEALIKRKEPASPSNRQVTLLNVRDQQVSFRVQNGRVYHQNMEFQVGDVTMRSQGSVGLDETISLTLEIPIQDDWVQREPLLAGLKGQSLRIPVSGTLKRPQMDQRAISSLTSQLLQKGAGQAVGNELNRALDKFLKPR